MMAGMSEYPGDIEALKHEMCEIGRRIWQRGFCAGNEGNHSVRIGEDRALVTPTRVSKGFLRPEMICTIDFDGNKVAGHPDHNRSSEALMHLGIYRANPALRSIVHSHPPHVTAFAIAGVPLPEGIHPEAEIFLGRVPLAEYATPSRRDLPDSIVRVMRPETAAVMLANHGVTTLSTTGLVDAFDKLEVIEAYATVLLHATKLGRVRVLDVEQFTTLLEVKRDYFKMPDPRLAEAKQGIVGPHNAAFFEAFGVTPV